MNPIVDAYCVFSTASTPPRVGARIGPAVLDVAAMLPEPEFAANSLNPFMALGRAHWDEIDQRLASATAPVHVPVSDIRLHMPFDVADFVDFYSSLEHATNTSKVLRPGSPGVLPSWRELPIGYHGRSGTVSIGDAPVHRPAGQLGRGDERPEHAPTRKLDFEAEVAFVVGTASRPGHPVPVTEFDEHVFGTVLLIDWSARDIQAFEYRPLGPFLGKSFATTISPWVIRLPALSAARVAGPPQDPPPLPYLHRAAPWGLDLSLEVRLNGELVSRPSFATMYWTAAQQLAHMTVNGATLRTGDLYASGTVSSYARDGMGSLLELSVDGREPVPLASGRRLAYLEDGDAISLSGTAPGPDGSVLDLGTATGRIAAAH